MASKDMYQTLKQSFREIVDKRGIRDKSLTVSTQEAAGSDSLGAGKEVKLTANFDGVAGECFTAFPGQFSGTLATIVDMDIENDPVQRSIYIAALNAVMNKYEMADDCLSCGEDDRVKCAQHILNQYRKNNGKVNFLLIGYHPEMAEALATHFPLRILDSDRDNIGKTFFGVTIEDEKEAYSDATGWAGVIVCTSSTLANGTIFDYIKLPKDVAFYGTSIAGTARILGLKRICPYGRNEYKP